MVKKGAIILALTMIIGFGLIVAVPIGVLSVGLLPYGIINYSESFEYLPDSPSSVETLNLNVDIGDIEIKYIDPPVDYFVKIDVNIEMFGLGLAGKSYSHYFNITEGDKTSSPFDFSISLFPNVTQSEVDSLIRDVSITVTLRKSVNFDISTIVTEGNVDLSVPFNVYINNLNFNVTNGDISFDLTKCIVEGNITGVTKNGKIALKSYNVEYTQDSVWTLSSIKNKIYITQNNPMGANVTGTIRTTVNVGTYLVYNDYTSEVGAKFTLYNYLYGAIHNGTYENFVYYLEPMGENRWTFRSNDFFTANNSYFLRFYIEGILNYNLFSA